MSTFASFPLETMTFGLEKTLPSPKLSNALIARRKSSTESCPEKPRAFRHAMSAAESPAPSAAPIVVGERAVYVRVSVVDEEAWPVVLPSPSIDVDDVGLLDWLRVVSRVP